MEVAKEVVGVSPANKAVIRIPMHTLIFILNPTLKAK